MLGEPVRRVFPAEAQAVAAVREFVGRVANGCPCDVDAALLVASELATNAIVHARSPFSVAVLAGADGLTIEVIDDDPVAPTARDAGADALSGRGMTLVAAVAASWGSHPAGSGKAVWAHL